jgi:hypothetical protein
MTTKKGAAPQLPRKSGNSLPDEESKTGKEEPVILKNPSDYELSSDEISQLPPHKQIFAGQGCCFQEEPRVKKGRRQTAQSRRKYSVACDTNVFEVTIRVNDQQALRLRSQGPI